MHLYKLYMRGDAASASYIHKYNIILMRTYFTLTGWHKPSNKFNVNYCTILETFLENTPKIAFLLSKPDKISQVYSFQS